MVPEKRPAMPADLFNAAIQGNRHVLVQRLGLAEEEGNDIKVQIETFDQIPQETATKNHSFESELQSATRFGDTMLHLLVAKNRNNELAIKVFRKDMTLLTAQNNELETPLHYAARVGNIKVIQNLINQLAPAVVKDVLAMTNNNEDTALHVATKNGHKYVVCELMKIDPEMVYKSNKEGLSPVHMAVADDNIDMVKIMLEVDPTVACTQFSDGTFLIHVVVRMGSRKIALHLIRNLRKCASLLDSRGRNFLHVAAVENKKNIFLAYFEESFEDVYAKDCEGNTALHIAAMKGNQDVVFSLLPLFPFSDQERNNKGQTPFDLAVTYAYKNITKNRRHKIEDYIERKGRVFTREWYQLDPTPQEVGEKTQEMLKTYREHWDKCRKLSEKSQEKSEKSQVIGLGSVLITTVAFAAAFTVPGGYNADHGTPILGKRYMLRAFTIANALAFVEAFASIFLIIMNTLEWKRGDHFIEAAKLFFLAAGGSMVKAFGIGSYVMMAPINLPLAIGMLVLALLFASSAVISSFGQLGRFSKWLSATKSNFNAVENTRKSRLLLLLVTAVNLAWRVFPYLAIFGVAALLK